MMFLQNNGAVDMRGDLFVRELEIVKLMRLFVGHYKDGSKILNKKDTDRFGKVRKDALTNVLNDMTPYLALDRTTVSILEDTDNFRMHYQYISSSQNALFWKIFEQNKMSVYVYLPSFTYMTREMRALMYTMPDKFTHATVLSAADAPNVVDDGNKVHALIRAMFSLIKKDLFHKSETNLFVIHDAQKSQHWLFGHWQRRYVLYLLASVENIFSITVEEDANGLRTLRTDVTNGRGGDNDSIMIPNLLDDKLYRMSAKKLQAEVDALKRELVVPADKVLVAAAAGEAAAAAADAEVEADGTPAVANETAIVPTDKQKQMQYTDSVAEFVRILQDMINRNKQPSGTNRLQLRLTMKTTSSPDSEYRNNAQCAMMWLIFRDMYTFMPGMYNYIMSTVLDMCPTYSEGIVTPVVSDIICQTQATTMIGGKLAEPLNMSLPALGYVLFQRYGDTIDNSTLLLVEDGATKAKLRSTVSKGETFPAKLNRMCIELLFKDAERQSFTAGQQDIAVTIEVMSMEHYIQKVVTKAAPTKSMGLMIDLIASIVRYSGVGEWVTRQLKERVDVTTRMSAAAGFESLMGVRDKKSAGGGIEEKRTPDGSAAGAVDPAAVVASPADVVASPADVVASPADVVASPADAKTDERVAGVVSDQVSVKGTKRQIQSAMKMLKNVYHSKICTCMRKAFRESSLEQKASIIAITSARSALAVGFAPFILYNVSLLVLAKQHGIVPNPFQWLCKQTTGDVTLWEELQKVESLSQVPGTIIKYFISMASAVTEKHFSTEIEVWRVTKMNFEMNGCVYADVRLDFAIRTYDQKIMALLHVGHGKCTALRNTRVDATTTPKLENYKRGSFYTQKQEDASQQTRRRERDIGYSSRRRRRRRRGGTVHRRYALLRQRTIKQGRH
jgi:hypothetical protein